METTPATNRPIRILHLEDSPRDAALIRDKLESEDLPCDITVVSDRTAFEAALANETFDLIFCDFGLPGYDGMTATRFAKEKQPDTPVIVISGTLGEDEAVACLQIGATDYLLKQRLDRLAPAVRRAIEEAAHHRASKAVETKLRESEERFRQLAEHGGDAFRFVALNPERLLYVSPAFEKIWGLPMARLYANPRAWLEAVQNGDRARVLERYEACLSGKTPRFEAEYQVLRPDGTRLWVLDSGTPIRNGNGQVVRMGGISKDITDRKLAELQMHRSQRLESIGTLAGGIAHDLNNTLAPILAAVGLLRDEPGERSGEFFDIIEASVRRGADMVRQLLTFARGVEGEKAPCLPNYLFDDIAKIVGNTFPKSIQVRTSIAPELPLVVCDSTQMHRVLLNLCVNARDAMPDGGILTLDTSAVHCDAGFTGFGAAVKPGLHVLFRVSDTGTGIPPEIMDRIFDPFFSTKSPDKGTGLGLSTVMGIVKSHGGFVRVRSNPGHGSCFEVYLPVAKISEIKAKPPRDEPEFQKKDKSVLVVDDEPAIRMMLKLMLTKLGCKVHVAANGADALMQFSGRHHTLDLILTDLNMPQMDGSTMIHSFRRNMPDVKVIVMTGLDDGINEEALRKLGNIQVLHKPFDSGLLKKTLKAAFMQADTAPVHPEQRF